MPRERIQRPEVHEWIGKSGAKFWKGEWRVYIEGRPKPKHRAATWPQGRYTKTKAQKELDKLVQEETGGEIRPDGSMTVSDFWTKVFWPIRSHRITQGSSKAYQACWRNHIEPAIGKQEIQHVTKFAISSLLDRIADKKLGASMVERALFLCRGIFEEAAEDGYIVRDPVRRVTPPQTKANGETRPLSEAEARRLIEKTEGRDRLMWSVLLRTGVRIGELLALQKCDIEPGGLRVDESSYMGHASTTKNKKTRVVPISALLRAELEEWATDLEPVDLLFPNRDGRMFARQSSTIKTMLDNARKSAEIPDLRFRMTRTTFATLFGGDPSDAQAILGHSKVDMTMRHYRKAQAERQMAALEDWDARLSGKVVTMPKKEKQA